MRDFVSEKLFQCQRDHQGKCIRLAGSSGRAPRFLPKPIPAELVLWDPPAEPRQPLIAGNVVPTQGQSEKCLAFAGCCLCEFQTWSELSELQRKEWGRERPLRFSADYLYSLRSNRPQEGMSGADLMRILVQHGNIFEEDWPVHRRGGQTRPLPASSSSATANNVYAQVKTVQGLKEALLHNGPCPVVLPFYADAPTAEFWIPASSTSIEDEIGHAMTFVGYSDRHSAFLARNSWGPEWNGNGHVWIPYDDVASGKLWEIWTLFYDGKAQLEYYRQLLQELKPPSADPIHWAPHPVDRKNNQTGYNRRWRPFQTRFGGKAAAGEVTAGSAAAAAVPPPSCPTSGTINWALAVLLVLLILLPLIVAVIWLATRKPLPCPTRCPGKRAHQQQAMVFF